MLGLSSAFRASFLPLEQARDHQHTISILIPVQHASLVAHALYCFPQCCKTPVADPPWADADLVLRLLAQSHYVCRTRFCLVDILVLAALVPDDDSVAHCEQSFGRDGFSYQRWTCFD